MTIFMVNGNIVADAQTRLATKTDGAKTAVTDFSVAVKDGYADNEVVQYWKVTVWGDRGSNLAKYLTKGRNVNVKGLPTVGKAWIGEDGQAHNGALTIKRAEIELKGAARKGEPEAIEFEGEVIEE